MVPNGLVPSQTPPFWVVWEFSSLLLQNFFLLGGVDVPSARVDMAQVPSSLPKNAGMLPTS